MKSRVEAMKYVGALCSKLAMNKTLRIELAQFIFEDDTIKSYSDLSRTELDDVIFYLNGLTVMVELAGSGERDQQYPSDKRMSERHVVLEDRWFDQNLGVDSLIYLARKLYHDDTISDVSHLSANEVEDTITLIEVTQWYTAKITEFAESVRQEESSQESVSDTADKVDDESEPEQIVISDPWASDPEPSTGWGDEPEVDDSFSEEDDAVDDFLANL